MSAKFILAAVAATLAATAVPTTAAFADDRGGRYYSRDDDRRWNDDRRYEDRRYGQRYDNRRYDDRRYNDRRYNVRGQGRCYDEGKGGTVIGAIAGGLLGNSVAGYGDKLLGTVIGGGVGAVAGRAIDRSDGRDCRRR